ncbi:DNA-binding protein [Labedella endophytica]|uniref:DNA-binding protein n=1 Tax=Labedella endophytica TaxID=1523160 RepID=A0A3S0XY41_9MICO|nr:MGMT family protein [Labedella endophytica]RUQ98956.1 DNA-binding protein [Labedella endophytica]
MLRPEPEGDGPPTGDDFVEEVLAVVAAIPAGHVMSYGSVAAALGSRSARGVGRVMAHAGSGSPWWRVVRSGGLPPRGLEHDALPHYHAEDTPLVVTPSGYRVARSAWI